ncbi:MAG: PEP-CTERM sorting domain-containing protein, partial [Bacteroidales bacterium]|nr:PEP-CTERM sorting domain-containing protein [Bacteroidales bacterium]
ELPNNFSTNSNWPVLAELSGNGSSVRFGPYTQQQNKLYVDGVNITKNPVNAPLTLTTGVKHTATLTVYEGGITLKLDGQIAQTATLADTASGNIVDITLGGNKSKDYRLAENVYSISAYKVVPEPTSATLSLLALAGLAMRRRRKLA